MKDDPVLSELHLRRSFSALSLYGQAANKVDIATAIMLWSLPAASRPSGPPPSETQG
ncbi:MAG: hypothetical protein R3F07_18585 [Opitutaceae bacterium]